MRFPFHSKSFAACAKGKEFELNIPGSTTNLGEGELDTPDLTLVAETILANELQLGVTNRSRSVRGALST